MVLEICLNCEGDLRSSLQQIHASFAAQQRPETPPSRKAQSRRLAWAC
jgi:hypothetical protein